MHARWTIVRGARAEAAGAGVGRGRGGRGVAWLLACLTIGLVSLLTNQGQPRAMGAALTGMQLVMIEEDGCSFCLRWKREVGTGYPLSEEGRRAPLVVIDRASKEARAIARIVYTPTFVLMRDGVEKGRIVGYPGADFFWSMLGEMLRKQPLDQAAGAVRHAAPQ